MSGEVIETRVDAAALSLPPLALREEGTWDPAKEEPFAYEGPLAELWRAVAAQPWTVYAMQQVLPGADPDEPRSLGQPERSCELAGGSRRRALGPRRP